MDGYLGVQVGSEITECAISAEAGESITCKYLRTQGKPAAEVRRELGEIEGQFPTDAVENEVSAQAMAALYYVPDMLCCHCGRWHGFVTHHDA